MDRRVVRAFIGFAAIGGIIACSSAESSVGSNAAALSEDQCGDRTISPPNGAITSSAENDCSVPSETSSNATYGYLNCTNAYIWEVSAFSSGTVPDRIIDVSVGPATSPTDQATCEATHVGLYLHGLDTVDEISYGWSSTTDPDFSSISGTWVVPPPPFNSYCDFSAATIHNVDLDNWPDGSGGSVSVDGIRMVGQAYDDTTKEEVIITYRGSNWDAHCVNGE